MSQAAEKQRRRQQREQAEREQAARQQRTGRLRVAGLTAVGAVAVAAAALAVSRGSDPGPAAGGSSAAVGTFDAHYDGLQRRLTAVGLPTMATPQSAEHTHQALAVYVDGEQVPVPEDVGVDPSADPGQMAGLHTHAPGFTIHNEGVANPTLGQFFAVWGVAFSATRLGDHRAGGARQVRMWVDGNPSTQFDRLALRDGQRIAISFGAEPTAPPMPPAPVA